MLKYKKITISELVFIAILSVAMGIFWWAYTFLYDILSSFLRAFAAEGLLTGVWYMGGLFFPYIIRKPGSALLGEVIAAVVEGIFSHWGLAGSFLYGCIQGAPAELLFLLLSYRVWTTKIMCLGGLLAGLAPGLASIYFYQYYKFGISYCIIQVVCSGISGMFFAGFLSKVLADKMARTGVFNQFNIVNTQTWSLKMKE